MQRACSTELIKSTAFATTMIIKRLNSCLALFRVSAEAPIFPDVNLCLLAGEHTRRKRLAKPELRSQSGAPMSEVSRSVLRRPMRGSPMQVHEPRGLRGILGIQPAGFHGTLRSRTHRNLRQGASSASSLHPLVAEVVARHASGKPAPLSKTT